MTGVAEVVRPPAAGPTVLVGAPAGIRAVGVGRTHRMGSVEVPALRDVSLDIAPGEFVAIVGPSGSGKSTLLSLIGGLDRPTHGTLEVAGSDLGRLPDRALADFRLTRVGTIFQTFNLVPTLSARENVAMPMALAGVRRSERRARAARLLDHVGLRDRADFPPSRLSGGQQQRVAVARSLANLPGLLLADEPTGNLDSAAGAEVMELIQELHEEGATIVLVTHDQAVAARARRVVTLHDGRVVSDTGRRDAAPARPAPPRERRPARIRIAEAVRLGVASLPRRKLRTGLSAAGISVGIALIALIVSLVTGVQSELQRAVLAGPNLIDVTIQPDTTDPTHYQPFDQAALDRLTRLPGVRSSWGDFGMTGTLETDGRAPVATALRSQLPVGQRSRGSASFLIAGRLPTTDTADETVLSPELASRLGWSPKAAIGQTVTFRGLSSGLVATPGVRPATVRPPLTLTVVGVGPIAISGLPAASVPHDTMRQFWQQMATANKWQADEYIFFTLVADSAADTNLVKSGARAAGYQAQDAADSLSQTEQVLNGLGIALSTFAVVALVIAGLGIANTMYTAVLERTREVGILKALGARSSDVRTMFVAEAAAIGALGGLVGLAAAVLLGIVGNFAVNSLLPGQANGLHLTVFQLTPLVALAAVAGAAALSALSGLLPAIRASRLSPTLALRYE